MGFMYSNSTRPTKANSRVDRECGGICKRRAYSGPSPPSHSPRCQDLSGTHSGRWACVVPGTASELPESHPAELQPRVSDQPAGGPGRVASSARQFKVGRGIVHVIEGLGRERVGVLSSSRLLI